MDVIAFLSSLFCRVARWFSFLARILSKAVLLFSLFLPLIAKADFCDGSKAQLLELIRNGAPDCNGNQVPDQCDLMPREFNFGELRLLREVDANLLDVDPLVSDLNADGHVDIAMLDSANSRVSVFLRTGNEQDLAEPVAYAVPASPLRILAADLNEDDVPDLLVLAEEAASLSVLLNKGDGSFEEASSFTAGSAPVDFDVADFDGTTL